MKFGATAFLTSVSVSLLASGVSAVFSDEAYVVDWAKNPIGYLNSQNTVVARGSSNSEAIIGTFTESSVLASINGTDGTTLWRRWLDESDSSSQTHAVSSKYLAKVNNGLNELFVSASSDGRVIAWDPITGLAEWDISLEETVSAINGVAASANANTDQVFVALKSGFLLKLDALSGSRTWSSDLEIDSAPLAVIDLSDKVGVITSSGYLINVDKSDGSVHSRRKFGSATSVFSRSLDEVLSVHPVQGSSDTIVVVRSGSNAAIRVVDSNGNTASEESVVLASQSVKSTVEVTATSEVVNLLDSNIIIKFTVKGHTITRAEADINTSVNAVSENHPFPILSFPSGNTLAQTELGNLQLIDPLLEVVWSRQDGLTEITSAVFVDFLSDDSSLSEEELLFEEHADVLSAFSRRLARHWVDLKYFISHVKFPSASASNAEDDKTAEVPLTSHTKTESHDNLFGFHKLLVVANKYNHVFALDTTNQGAIVWSVTLPVPQGSEIVDLAVNSDTIYAVISTGEIFTVDVEGNVQPSSSILLPSDSVITEVVHTQNAIYAISNESVYTVVSSDSANDSPATESNDSTDEAVKSTYHTKVSDDGTTLDGYAVNFGIAEPQKTFQYTPGPNYRIVATAKRSPEDLTASIGKVLGDRSVLYKYLHRNAIAVAALNEETNTLVVTLLDSVTGRVLHTKVHKDEVSNKSPINLVFGEHWIVYSFYSKLPIEGQKIAVWDLYESEIPNQRHSQDDEKYSSFDSFAPPHVKSQSYIFNDDIITSLSVSRTRYGVTSRDIILTLSNGKVATLPKILLDARRPIGRNPTKEEQEEGLATYNSVIFLPPMNVLSHSRHLLGVNHIVSEPATLESTSLIAGFGPVDLFFTRITPSRPFDMLTVSFEKPKLIYTIMTILTVTIIVRRYALKKRIDQQWGVGEL
ncbi:Emc1p [Sugiyamaella lignohabitans]|uniref:ER membrane protein complex subunit 1 n=1 Tax=Sugiyamaella lignohabitans TaxID=796027 RepID=A0A167DR47_9ASCO|nr:Emc1p [Sugiyamaella lignohabitans]ANB13193.1 Emc1p [Sugiyamaella lignohabitans]